MNAFPSGTAQRFAFASLQRTSDIWSIPLVAAKGAAPQKLTTIGLATRPSMDRNGRTLVYITRPDSAGGERWIFGVAMDEGQKPSTGRQIRARDLNSGKDFPVVTEGTPSFPLISPDAQHLAYVDSADGRNALYLRKLSGGLPEKICESCGWPTSWAPDGMRIALDQGAGRPFLVLVDLKDHKQTEIIRLKEGQADSPSFSPDGSWIAWVQHSNPLTRQIFIAPARPSKREEWIPITEGSNLDRVPRWSADGETLYFTSKRDGFVCIWGQRLTRDKHPDGPPTAVAHLHTARLSADVTNTDVLGLAVTSKQIAIMLNEQTGNIWMAQPAPKSTP
jgi:Tol biopolymer transport system component